MPERFEARNDERELHQVTRETQQEARETQQEAREVLAEKREEGEVARDLAQQRRAGQVGCPVCALSPLALWGGIIAFATGVGSTLALVSVLSVNLARLEAKTEAVEKSVYRIEAKLDLSTVQPARKVAANTP